MNSTGTSFMIMILVIGTLLMTGCIAGDCPVVKHSLVLSKISADGNYQWTQTLDSGIDNRIKDVVPTPDGGVVIAGSLSEKGGYCAQDIRPRIIRISGSGNIVWDRIFEEDGKAAAVNTLRDGGYSAVFSSGDVIKTDRDGKTVWKRDLGNQSEFWALSEDEDGNIVIAGPMVMKLNRSGAIIWQRDYPDSEQSEARSVYSPHNGRGYLLQTTIPGPYDTSIIVISQFDTNGNLVTATQIPENSYYIQRALYQTTTGFEIFYSGNESDRNKTGVITFDTNGIPVEKTTIGISFPLARSKDSGYIITEFQNREAHIIKINQNLSREWDCTLPGQRSNGLIGSRIVETTDGGFVIGYLVPGNLVDLSQ